MRSRPAPGASSQSYAKEGGWWRGRGGSLSLSDDANGERAICVLRRLRCCAPAWCRIRRGGPASRGSKAARGSTCGEWKAWRAVNTWSARVLLGGCASRVRQGRRAHGRTSRMNTAVVSHRRTSMPAATSAAAAMCRSASARWMCLERAKSMRDSVGATPREILFCREHEGRRRRV